MQRPLKQLFSSIQTGLLSTLEAHKYLHALCTEMRLNPTLEEPVTLLMMTQPGQNKLERYENFITNTNWLFAKVAAEHISIEEAIMETQRAMEKLIPCQDKRGTFFTCCPYCRDEFIPTGRKTSKFEPVKGSNFNDRNTEGRFYG